MDKFRLYYAGTVCATRAELENANAMENGYGLFRRLYSEPEVAYCKDCSAQLARKICHPV